MIAPAILDRLLHHSTTINIRGESYRQRKKTDQPPFLHLQACRTVLAVKAPLRRAKPSRP